MRTWNDVSCHRCGCTSSCTGVDPEDLRVSHVCPDGVRPDDAFTITERVVAGPGERGRDDEEKETKS